MSRRHIHSFAIIILPCLLSSFFTKSFSQVHADFSAVSTSGCTPITVNFKNNSTGGATTFQWNLGNGTVSTLENPAATYFAPGTYTVRLTASNGEDKSTITKTDFITVYAKPNTFFDTTFITGCYPLTVPFNDKSTAGSGTIVSWLWDFGDGNISSVQNPTHTYQNVGKFNVTLTIKNSNGCSTTFIKTNLVTITDLPVASFSNAPFPPCTIPVTIAFNNLSSGNNIKSYFWNFGDGQTSTAANPSHQYVTSGNYTVSLTVSSVGGCNDVTIKKTITNVGFAKADFTMPSSVCAGVPFNITSNNPLHATWTFSDGTTDNNINPLKTFASSGVYTVKLFGDYGGCIDSITKSITILPLPTASFKADATASCTPPFTVNFTNTSVDGTVVSWDFGDGTTSTSLSPSHTYTAIGNFAVKLNVVNANGCVGGATVPSYINIAPPKITSINGPPYNGCVPYTATFSATTASLNNNISYSWNFGDGSTSTSQNPSHTYTVEGIYNVKLTINTPEGCTDTFTMTNAVTVGIKPHAAFVATPLFACPDDDVYFTDQSTGGADHFLWSFGDGGISTLQNPVYNYNDTGFNNVRLIATRFGCSDTLTKINYVYIKPPTGQFIDSFVCGNQFQHYFIDKSIGAVYYKWYFGDGDSSTLHSPSHLYANTGLYQVKLLVTNDNCHHTVSYPTYVLNEHAGFNFTDTIGCTSTLKEFTSTSNPSYIASYLWNFGNGDSASGASYSHVAYNYDTGGIYNVKLKIIDLNNCPNEITKPVVVTKYRPVAKFTVPNIFCKNTTVTFTDLSNSDSSKIVKWIWDFGDNKGLITFNGPPFIHTYTKNGVYNVVLVVINGSGCTDTTHKIVTVNIIGPVADFSTSAPILCMNTTLNFQNKSSGNIASSFWDFGDGNTSTNLNASHSYTAEKIYSIKLTVVDTSGCIDTITKDSIIQIANPHALFAMSDSFSNCPPLLLKLTNQSTNFSSMRWDFGDGNTSVIPNPSHTYVLPGSLNIKLFLTGTGGCNDSLTRQLRIAGPNGTFTYGPLIGCTPLVVHFSNTTINTVNYTWDFDDGVAIFNTNTSEVHAYPHLGTYLPKIILQDSVGCKVPIYGLDSIRVKGVDVYTKDLPTYLICDSASVAFQDLSITNDTLKSFYWEFGDGTVSNDQNPIHRYNVTGNYTVSHRVTTTSGCVDYDTLDIPIKLVYSPKMNVTGPDSLCVPALAQFNATWLNQDTSTIFWHWNFGDGKDINTQTPPAHLYPVAGTYSIIFMAINGSGCANTITEALTVLPLPSIDASPSKFICLGQSYPLIATGGKTYVWDAQPTLSCTNCFNPVATPTEAKLYKVTGTDIYGCQSKDSVLVQVKKPFAMAVGIGDTLCYGESFRLLASGAESYTWFPSTYLNNPTIANPLATPETSVKYRVVGHDTVGCFNDTGYITIKVYPIPKIDIIEQSITVTAGSTVQLHTTVSDEVTQLHWVPAIGLSCTNCPQPTATPKEDITYTLTATNDGGCTAQDKVSLLVVCGQGNIYVPNTFSPNNDGVNDIFYPRGKGIFGIKGMRIFSRWGELLYEKTNFQANEISSGWDGTYKGQKLEQDVFVYVIEVVCENNKIFTLKGNITMVR